MDDEDDRPPHDELAERITLWHILHDPELVQRVDMAPLLVSAWQHTAIWNAMRRVAQERPAAVVLPFDFFTAWATQLCRAECRTEWAGIGKHEFWTEGRCAAHHMWVLLEQAREDEWKGVTVNDHGLMVCALPHHAGHARADHTLTYWLARLTAVRDARAQLRYAYRIADDAWHWYRQFDDPKPEQPNAAAEIEALVS